MSQRKSVLCGLLLGLAVIGSSFVFDDAPGDKKTPNGTTWCCRIALGSDKDSKGGKASTADNSSRVLFRLGTDSLRTRGFTSLVAFSPDGELIAAVGANSPAPAIDLFNVRTGKLQKRVGPAPNTTGTVQCFAFFHDQSKIVWSDNTGHLAIWDLRADQLVRQEKTTGNNIACLAISADDKQLACVRADASIHVRQLANLDQAPQILVKGVEQKNVRPNLMIRGNSPQKGLVFTPDGTHLVTGAAGKFSIWRLSDGNETRQFPHSHQILQTLDVTPDAKRIISSGYRTVPREQTQIKYGPKNVNLSEVRVWDLESGELLRELTGAEDNGFGFAALSKDGMRVAIADYSLLRILDVETGRLVREFKLPGTWGRPLDFSPTGNLVAMPLQQSVGLFEVSTGRQLHDSEDSPRAPIMAADWTPNGNQLVVGSDDGQIRVWDVDTGQFVRAKSFAPVISLSGWHASPRFIGTTDGVERIVVAGRRDEPVNYRTGLVSVYDVKTGLLIRSFEQDEIRWGAVSSDRQVVAVATSHGSINDTHVVGIDFKTGETLYTTPPADVRRGFWQVKSMVFLPGSSELLLADGNGDVIELDGMTGTEKRRFAADYRTIQKESARDKTIEIWDAAFSANGQRLAICSKNIVSIWDTATGKMTNWFIHPHTNGCQLALSNDGKSLAAADFLYVGDDGENRIRLYDVETCQEFLSLDTEDNRAVVLSFSHDGTKLFSGNTRGSGTVWNIKR